MLRDSNDINEHLARFRPGGLYHPMMLSGDVVAYVVVDLRGPKAASSPHNSEHLASLLTFTFNHDYTMAVFTHEGKPDGDLLSIGGG